MKIASLRSIPVIALSLALVACGSAPQSAAPQAPIVASETVLATAVPASTAAPAATTAPPAPSRTTRPAPAVSQVTPTAASGSVVGEVPADLLAKIMADAAQRSGVAAASIVVQQGEAVEWGDSSLGCPQPGIAYMQVITPGYQVVLQAGAETYDYHADSRDRFIVCPKK